jgi:hypothetical protein
MLVSLVPKRGGKLLILANGAYGARMATICKHHGLAYEVIETDEAQPLDAERVHGMPDYDRRPATAQHLALLLSPLPIFVWQVRAPAGRRSTSTCASTPT